MIRVLLAAICAVLAFASVSQAQNNAAQNNTDAVLILDASGSMWGQVDGQTKISAARAAVGTILSKWKPSDRLGLIAYGHRTRGDCKDIELLAPVSRFDPEKIRAAVNSLNPKGKTPIADSLRLAAQTLRASENKATVVLVSDGIETCAPDPCAVAAELKKTGIGFTAHVVGFDVADPAAKAQLQCIARVTGGVYLDARNASGLENALGRAVAAAQGGQVKSEASAKPVADPYQGKTIRGVVRLAAGLDPLTDPDVSWEVHQRIGNDEKGDFVRGYHGSPFADQIAPGDYIATVSFGQVTREVPFKAVRGKPALLDVVLDAGYVTSEGTILGSGAKAEDSVWEVRDPKDDVVASDHKPVPRFILPAGNYLLHLSRGQAAAQKPFTVAAGDSINVALTMDAGKLLVSGVYARGGPKIDKGISVEVRALPKSEAEDGDMIAAAYDPISQFDLPSGTYDVVVSVGEARKMVRAEVKSGSTTRLDVNIEAGVLGLKTGNGRTIEIFGAERDINNERQRVYASHEPDLNLALNAGNYVAVVEYEDDRRVEKAFTVVPGKRVDVQVRP